MAKEKSKKIKEEKIEKKIVEIGEFTKPKEGVEELPKEEEVKEEILKEEIPKEEAIPTELTPEQIKEKILALVSEIGSRGLTEEERAKFIDDLKFWNGILFNALDLGDNLKTVISQVHIQLTPTKAVLIYTLGTIGSIILLRPDLAKRVFGTKGKVPEVKPIIEKKPVETKPEEGKPTEKIEEGEKIAVIPKEAPI